MKRIIKSAARTLWRMSWPVRRPFVVRIDARVSRLIAGTIDARLMPPIVGALEDSSSRLERIERTIERADRAAANMAEEMDVVLNGLTREVFRLQAQVERLQRGLGEAGRPDPNVLSILDAETRDAPARAEVEDRARVG